MKTKDLMNLTLLAAFVLTPALSFAKDNDHANKAGNNNNECLKAWGQFVKNGWKQTKGEISLNANCRVPYGIFKKFNFIPNSPTTDTTAPVINSFNVAPKTTEVQVNWTANEKARAVVFYGTSTPVVAVNATTTNNADILASVSSSNAAHAIDDRMLSKDGRLTIKNLTASTTYYAVLAVRDAAGNVKVSNAVTFTTTVNDSADTVAPIIGSIVTTISLDKLRIDWTTNELATSKLYYGTTSLNIAATSTASMGHNTPTRNHSFELPVNASTTSPYYVILQSVDASGNTRTSSQYTINLPF